MNIRNTDKKIVIILAVLVVTLLVGVGVLGFFFLQERKANENKTFNIDNVDPSIANQLSGSIVYSSEESEDASYFSSSLDITFKYNSKLLTASETSGAVAIYPKDYDAFGSGYLELVKTTDVKGIFLMDTFYTDIEVSKEEDGDGFKKLLLEYSEKSLLDPSKSTTKYLTVLYKQFSTQQSAYIKVTDFNYTENADLTAALGKILTTISTDTSGVEKEIEASMSNGLVKVKFDRDLWSLSYQTNTSLSIMGVDDNDGSISMYLSSVYSAEQVKDIDALKAQISEKITSKREYFDENQLTFETVGEIGEVVLGDVTFAKGTYKYNYGSGTDYYESTYVGYLSGSEQQLDITTQAFGSDNVQINKDIETVLQSIVFADEQLYSMRTENVLGTSSVSINIASVLGQASTVHIYSKECNNVSFSYDMTGFNVAGNTYKICTAGFGSGFVVNDEGDIVSNAHVVDPNDFDAVAQGFSTDGEYELAIAQDLIALLVSQYGISAVSSMTAEQAEYYLGALLNMLYTENYMTITFDSRSLYVQGNDTFDINKYTADLSNASQHYKATLIESNKISSSVQASLSENPAVTDIADLGVIKLVENVALPSMSLNSAEALTGETIYVVGYPGVADNSSLVNTATVLSSTVTKGTVSAIKPSTNSTFNLVQIDASIDHGNSGGPIINEEGSVVGVATYGLSGSGSGNYNAGVSVMGVKTFLDESMITASSNDVRDTLVGALNDISKSYYARALEKLESLVAGNENLELTINPYIELCKSKIEAGEDQTPWIDIGIDLPNWALLLIGGVIILFIGAGILLVVTLNKNKKSGGQTSDPVNPPQETIVAPVTEVPAPQVPQQVIQQQPVVDVTPVQQPIQQQPVVNVAPVQPQEVSMTPNVVPPVAQQVPTVPPTV